LPVKKPNSSSCAFKHASLFCGGVEKQLCQVMLGGKFLLVILKLCLVITKPTVLFQNRLCNSHFHWLLELIDSEWS